MTPIRLLIADDSRSLRSILRSVLRPLTQEFEILEASDGFEALEAFGAKPFDVVFMDVNMPRMNGLDALAGIKAMNKDAFVVMLTADADGETVAQAKALGADGYVTKPFTSKDMQALIDTYLKRRSQRYSVLVADDSGSMRAICRKALRQLEWGFDVIEAADGAEALRLFQDNRFDLVFMDVHMPNMDGLEALKRIRAANPNAYVVMLTADRSAESVKSAISAGASEYLLKPFTVEQLNTVMGRFRTRRAA